MARRKREGAAQTTPEIPEMTPKEAVDLLYDRRDNAVMSGESEAKPRPPKYASDKDEARSSRAATDALADPAKVARIREQLGEFYRIEDVAAALQVTTRTVLQYLRDGKLEGVKLGGQWRISIDALRRFMRTDRHDVPY